MVLVGAWQQLVDLSEERIASADGSIQGADGSIQNAADAELPSVGQLAVGERESVGEQAAQLVQQQQVDPYSCLCQYACAHVYARL